MAINRNKTNHSRFRPSVRGYSSHSAVIIASKPPNVLSSPSVISIRKNIMDQNTDPSIIAIACGYTMKTCGEINYYKFPTVCFTNPTKPGPSPPTWSIDLFCTWAI